MYPPLSRLHTLWKNRGFGGKAVASGITERDLQFPTTAPHSAALPVAHCSLSPEQVRQPAVPCLSSPEFPLAGHLRSSLNDRMDLIIQKAKPKLQDSDDISHVDIQLKIEDFISRVQQVLGQPFPLQIMEKLCMLRELLIIIAT